MTEQELIQENETLNTRLQKAATVFKEQKAIIDRLTSERDAALLKAEEANKQDELFFKQQEEIEELKKNNKVLMDEKNTLNERLTKASNEYTKLMEEKNVLVTKFNKILEILK